MKLFKYILKKPKIQKCYMQQNLKIDNTKITQNNQVLTIHECFKEI